jgi:predicted metal-binding membrane protein|tara:strand:+ start:906 stop:1664 length:759 start_codon:yes stop_codon:yes gene_type:complete
LNKLSKDYFFILISLSVLVAIAWGYLIAMDNEMNVFDKFYFFTMPMTGNWTINDFIVMGIMWLVMMFAMMMPSTFIFLFIFHSMRSNMASVKNPKFELFLLSFTYFFIWAIFSFVVCFLQYLLHNKGIISMSGIFVNDLFAATTLIFAGLFQFTNIKDSCLEKCKNPLSFIMGKRIDTFSDIISVGFKHGIFCLGCCWALMLILFVNGVMNLLWIVILTLAVLAEKIIPFGKLTSRFFGFLLVFWGAYLIIF